MSATTGIEWADHTHNIVWGCMKVSPGCAHCYAEGQARRYGHDVWGPAATTPRRTLTEKYWNEPLVWNRAAEKAGARRRVFCGSMCDVFEDHPTVEEQRERLWPVIRLTPHLDWLLLTKRPERVAGNLPDDWGEGYHNVWLGTSVESQRYANERIPHLLDVPARVRFLSCEPLLGPVDLTAIAEHIGPLSRVTYSALDPHGRDQWRESGIHWVIVGGESGAGARPMWTSWARELRDECAAAGVPFFLKQLGGHPDKRGKDQATLAGQRYIELPRSFA